MKKKMRFLNLLAVLIVLFTGVYQASAANLRARSQVISAANGYPNWYQDNNNLALSLCLDQNGFCVLPNAFTPPANKEAISPANFPIESFYYMADTSGVSPGGTIDLTLYEAALEAGFVTVQADGQQAVFTRIRIRADVTVPGTYTVIHPYGTKSFTITTIDPGNFEINDTFDVPGLVAGAFDAALTSAVGPFLTRADGIFPVDNAPGGTGNKYIGIPLQAVAVTGGVGGVNSVTITGPGADTLTLNTFSLMGKVIGLTIAPPVSGTDFGFAKLTPAAGVTKTFALTNLTANAFTPVIAANVPNSNPVVASTDFIIAASAVTPCPTAPATLAPNASCNFDVTFVPATDGLKTATIVASGPDVPPAQTTVTGTGDGIAPTVALDTPTIFTQLTAQTITGTVADNVGGAGVASVDVTVNAGIAAAATVTGGTWSFNATGLTLNAVNNVSVTATDLALPPPGNTSAASTGTITVDTIAPTGVAINAVTSPINITTQTITGTASDLNGISSVSVSVNGTVQGTATVTGATWSFNVTGLTLNAANTIIATATDPAGNSTASAPATITVDTIPPALALTAVTTPTKAAVQTIGGTVEAGATVTVNGLPATVTGTAWSFTLPLPAPDGDKSITIIATDAAANTTTVNSSITLDTVPPVATIGGTPANPTNNTGATLTVAGDQVVSYRWKIDSGALVGTYSTDNTPVATPILLTGLADGLHTVSVIGMDAAGNEQLQANATQVSWTVDTVLPALVLNQVTTLTKLSSQLLTGTMEAGAAVAVNGQPATATSATTWSFTLLLTAPDGTKPVSVTATDAATNVTTAPPTSITLDTAPPALNIVLTPENTPTRITTQTISGTVEAGATVVVTPNTAAASHVDVVGATWSTTIIGLVEGANGITVTATDPAGNPTIQQSSILIILPDGKITGAATVSLADAMKSLQFAAGLIPPTAVETLHADVAPLVNGIPSPNGKVDTGDVVLILRKVVEPTSW